MFAVGGWMCYGLSHDNCDLDNGRRRGLVHGKTRELTAARRYNYNLILVFEGFVIATRTLHLSILEYPVSCRVMSGCGRRRSRIPRGDLSEPERHPGSS